MTNFHFATKKHTAANPASRKTVKLKSSLADAALRAFANDPLIKALDTYHMSYKGRSKPFTHTMQMNAFKELLNNVLKKDTSLLTANTRDACAEMLPGMTITETGVVSVYKSVDGLTVKHNDLSASGIIAAIMQVKSLNEQPQPFTLSLANKCTSLVRMHGSGVVLDAAGKRVPIATAKKAAAKAAMVFADNKNPLHGFALFLLRMKKRKDLSSAGGRLFSTVKTLLPLLLTRTSQIMADAVQETRSLIGDLRAKIPKKLKEKWMAPVLEPVSGKMVPDAQLAFLDETCACFSVGDDAHCPCLPSTSSLPQLFNSLSKNYKVGRVGRKNAVRVTFVTVFPGGNSMVVARELIKFISALRKAKGAVRERKIKQFILFLSSFHVDSFSRHVCVEGRLMLTRKLLGKAAPEAVRAFDALRIKTCAALHKKHWDVSKWGAWKKVAHLFYNY
ncbi:hypothetical protein TeGR_g3252 [Tetraparma gracilis]|uniref:Uncharacterized protein n=1 Tax=Tetraparma gracilis TaxID=2962635 RepID=A0ABQ6MK11_9STRA|nr:hypothetical protein TeGR_g3252 [Tetraparma gracilis]